MDPVHIKATLSEVLERFMLDHNLTALVFVASIGTVSGEAFAAIDIRHVEGT
jgi:hypothetical protein